MMPNEIRHVLPELGNGSGVGSGLVRRAVALTVATAVLMVAALTVVMVTLQIEVTIDANGTLEPLHIWRIHSFAAGVIYEVEAVSGQQVAQGQVLARLDPFALERELESLRLEARHKRHQRQPRGEIDRLEQAIDTLEQRLRRHVLRAPVNGVILSEELDQLVGQHVVAGQLLFELGSIDSWKATLEIPERAVDPIRVGDPVKLTVPALAKLESWIPEKLTATVTFVGSEPTSASTPSRSVYRLHASLEGARPGAEASKHLRRGMSVDAKIITRSARAVDLLIRHVKRQVGIDG